MFILLCHVRNVLHLVCIYSVRFFHVKFDMIMVREYVCSSVQSVFHIDFYWISFHRIVFRLITFYFSRGWCLFFKYFVYKFYWMVIMWFFFLLFAVFSFIEANLIDAYLFYFDYGQQILFAFHVEISIDRVSSTFLFQLLFSTLSIFLPLSLTQYIRTFACWIHQMITIKLWQNETKRTKQVKNIIMS